MSRDRLDTLRPVHAPHFVIRGVRLVIHDKSGFLFRSRARSRPLRRGGSPAEFRRVESDVGSHNGDGLFARLPVVARRVAPSVASPPHVVQ
jgi:hypothetical protein